MNKKYWMNRKVIFFVVGLYELMSLVAFLSSPRGFTFEFGSFAIVSIGVFLFLELMYTHVKLESRTLARTDYFFFKKAVSVEKISAVSYQPTFAIFGKTNRSLYIFLENKDRPIIEMSNTWFTEETLRQMIHDLKQLNSNIVLNKEAERLLK